MTFTFRRTAFVAALLIPMTSAFSQNDDSVFIRRLSNQILARGIAYEDLRILTKNIGGRLAGSPGMVKAENWGKATLRSAGADSVIMQECLVPHWVRGGKDEVTITGKLRRPLAALAIGNSIGTVAAGITAPVVVVDSFDELEAKKDSLKGKIVFYNYKFKDTFVHTFEAYGDAVKYRGLGASRAAKYGALAVLVRSMSNSTDNFPHTGALRYDSSMKKIPAVAIGLRDADWLANALARQKLSVHMRTNAHCLPDTVGHNVIGELRGTKFPDQYITVGGHLDSWDPAEGAHDDGTGIVQTIEVLRAFKALGYAPRHTIRFVLFANEENGSRGGEKYLEVARDHKEHHVFAVESDEGGFTPRGFRFEVTDSQFATLTSWKQLLAPYGGDTFIRGGDGEDISGLHTDLKVPTAGFMPDSQRYFDYHHTPNDVFENVNRRELELGAVNIAALIYLVDKYGL